MVRISGSTAGPHAENALCLNCVLVRWMTAAPKRTHLRRLFTMNKQ